MIKVYKRPGIPENLLDVLIHVSGVEVEEVNGMMPDYHSEEGMENEVYLFTSDVKDAEVIGAWAPALNCETGVSFPYNPFDHIYSDADIIQLSDAFVCAAEGKLDECKDTALLLLDACIAFLHHYVTPPVTLKTLLQVIEAGVPSEDDPTVTVLRFMMDDVIEKDPHGLCASSWNQFCRHCAEARKEAVTRLMALLSPYYIERSGQYNAQMLREPEDLLPVPFYKYSVIVVGPESTFRLMAYLFVAQIKAKAIRALCTADEKEMEAS